MKKPAIQTASILMPAARVVAKVGILLLVCLSLSGCYYYAYDTDPVNSDVYYGRDAHAYPATVYGHYSAYDDWLGFGFFGPFGYISYWDNHYYTYGYPHRYYSPYYSPYYRGYYSHRRNHRYPHYDGRHDGHRRDRHDRGDRDRKYDRPRTGRYLNPGRVREDNRVRYVNPRDGRNKGALGAEPRQQRRSPLSNAVYQQPDRRRNTPAANTGQRPQPGRSRAGAVAPNYSAPPANVAPASSNKASRASAPRRSSHSGRGGKGERKRRQ